MLGRELKRTIWKIKFRFQEGNFCQGCLRKRGFVLSGCLIVLWFKHILIRVRERKIGIDAIKLSCHIMQKLITFRHSTYLPIGYT